MTDVLSAVLFAVAELIVRSTVVTSMSETCMLQQWHANSQGNVWRCWWATV